ncbi:MAG: radical SAM protein [Eubacterium sp.]|nr:radical SAM protein [Eubacterium sp.]
MICNSCPRKCNTDRENTLGFCKSPERFRVARAALHYWEEPCISGKNGSGTVFFSGCNMRCVFCQNGEISRENKGVEISDGRLIEVFNSLIEQGAHNINLVNPTHYAERLKEVLERFDSPVPIVYNTSGYESVDTLKKLDGLVDIYLTDYKYSKPEKASRYSKAGDYCEVARAAIGEMCRQIPAPVFDGDIMQKGVIIRHLILPSNSNSALEVIDDTIKSYGGAYLSLMAQYTPCGDLSEYPEIDRRLTKREYEKVINHALSTGYERIFVQETESADKKFIPAFDFTGIM